MCSSDLTNDYDNIIIGDSTMDISTRYTGFLSANSYSYAVAGNTACDMIEQLETVNVKNVKHIIISTSDGNGLLRGISISIISNTVKQLVESLKAKYPEAKITIILIHPVQVSQAENKRSGLNDLIKSDSGANCFIDPSGLFVNGAKDYLDSIHYTETISFKVKSLLETCGVFL